MTTFILNTKLLQFIKLLVHFCRHFNLPPLFLLLSCSFCSVFDVTFFLYNKKLDCVKMLSYILSSSEEEEKDK